MKKSLSSLYGFDEPISRKSRNMTRTHEVVDVVASDVVEVLDEVDALLPIESDRMGIAATETVSWTRRGSIGSSDGFA